MHIIQLCLLSIPNRFDVQIWQMAASHFLPLFCATFFAVLRGPTMITFRYAFQVFSSIPCIVLFSEKCLRSIPSNYLM